MSYTKLIYVNKEWIEVDVETPPADYDCNYCGDKAELFEEVTPHESYIPVCKNCGHFCDCESKQAHENDSFITE